MTNKYVCPECGEMLYLSKEHFYEIRQFINPKTGEIKKQTHREYGGPCDTLVSLHCIKCNFEYMEEDSGYPEFDEILAKSFNDENCKAYNFDDGFFKP